MPLDQRLREAKHPVDPFLIFGVISTVSASVSAAVTRILITRTKVKLVREALDGVPGPERPAVLRALAGVV